MWDSRLWSVSSERSIQNMQRRILLNCCCRCFTTEGQTKHTLKLTNNPILHFEEQEGPQWDKFNTFLHGPNYLSSHSEVVISTYPLLWIYL